MKKRIGVLLSGRGSNFEALAESVAAGRIPNAAIAMVISNREGAPGIDRAKARGIATRVIPSKGLEREAYDRQVAAVLDEHKVDLICLAGYMRLLSPYFVAKFPNRILNIHPSLLPSFPGLESQRQALEYGVKFAGCTVHFVDENLDAGPIIVQAVVPVKDDDTEASLSERILKEEHRIYSEAVRIVLEGKYKIAGRRVLQYAAAGNLVFSLKNDANRFGINAMLFFQDSFRERSFRVVVFHRNDGLHDDGARVEVFVHEMHGAAGEFHPVFQRLALRFEARKRRQQRRMNIQDAIRKLGHEIGREQAHVAGKANQVDFVLVENGPNLTVVDFALQPFRGNHARGDATRFGAIDSRSTSAIADDNGDFRVRDAARSHGFRQSFKVRAAAAQEHANALGHKRETLAHPRVSAKFGEKSFSTYLLST